MIDWLNDWFLPFWSLIAALNLIWEAGVISKTGMGTLEDGVDALETGVDTLEPGVDPLRVRMDSLEAGVDPLEAGVKSLVDGVDTLEAREDPLKDGVDPLEDDLQAGVDPLEDDLEAGVEFSEAGVEMEMFICAIFCGVDEGVKGVEDEVRLQDFTLELMELVGRPRKEGRLEAVRRMVY